MTEVGTSIERAGEVIRNGGVVAFPTETSYGLGASIYRDAALKAIYSIKKRPLEKPLLVLISRLEQLDELVSGLPSRARPFMERFWPGPLTMLFPAKEGLNPCLTNERGSVAIRLTDHLLARALIDAGGAPVTGTSANTSGMPPARSPDEVLKGLGEKGISYVLDGGTLKESPPSTILDVTCEPVEVLREGVISKEDILSVHWKGPSG